MRSITYQTTCTFICIYSRTIRYPKGGETTFDTTSSGRMGNIENEFEKEEVGVKCHTRQQVTRDKFLFLPSRAVIAGGARIENTKCRAATSRFARI